MKIKKMKWRNYKGLADGEIIADGHDVIISGRNGSGKTSIAEMLPFVLFGKVAGSLKRYDEKGLTIRDKQLHGVEIEFEDGLKLGRLITDSSTGGITTKLFIDGAPVQKRQFDNKVETITNGAGELILNPFAFFTMTAKEKRNFVARTFGAIGEREFLSTPENAEVAQILDGMTVESFIAKCKFELKTKHQAALDYPARIEELERQLASVPTDINGELKRIETDIEIKRSELVKLMTPKSQVQMPTQRISELERQESYLNRQLEREKTRRETLLAEYRQVYATRPGNCPTCNQPMPLDLFEAKRGEKLMMIEAEGKAVAAQIGEFKTELTNVRTELETLRAEAAELKTQAEQSAKSEAKRRERLTTLQNEINTLESGKMRLLSAMSIGERINELKSKERALNVEIVELEGKLNRAEKFQHEKIQRFEEQINANFEHVRFKLFDTLIDGTPREVCEAMIDGVPYSSLSKGEKLKAALDIWRAIQRHYGADLPLIIDDAESYTQNSLVDVKNQKIVLRVSENDLQIEVDERRQAA